MRTLPFVAISAAALLSACDVERPPVAYGNANSIIVVSSNTLWAEVSDTVETALQPRIFTVRPEKTFKLTHVSPAERGWGQLRRFKQVLVFGRPDDPWMTPVLDHANGPVPQPPGIVEADNVWANEQLVTGVVLPERGAAQAITSLLPQLQRRYDQRFRRYVADRMFMSGVDEKLARRLQKEAGFSLTVPDVYKWQKEDSAYVFTNSIVEPKELYRVITVEWRPGQLELSPDSVLTWRDSLVKAHYPRPQLTERKGVRSGPVHTATGRAALEVHGVWKTPEGLVPAGGPFIDWVIRCPRQDRTYLVDASLYAPAYDKYEYMIQLRTILRSFRCGGEPAAASAAG